MINARFKARLTQDYLVLIVFASRVNQFDEFK